MRSPELIETLQPQVRLKDLLAEHGVTQTALGEAVGVSDVAVYRWRIGVKKPTKAHAIAVAAFFGESLETMWSYRPQGGWRWES